MADWVALSTTGNGTLGPDVVPAGSMQFVAQHKRAAVAAADCSPLLAFLQQLAILPWSPEWSGIPDATPPAIARSKRMEVSRFFTLNFLSRLPIPLSALAVNIP
ncbi:MAG: hypothetical protein JNJ39_09410 [Blastocatellia bacterium]|nr:hypothetical protein [Blastocatellia bacterium]